MKKSSLFLSMILTVLVAVLTAGMLSLEVFAETSEQDVENPDFTVTMESGLDGIAVENTAMPITLTCENTGKDFSGVLRVILPATYNKGSIAYEKAVAIPSGGKKSFSMLLPDIDAYASVRVELETERGKTIYSKEMPFQSMVVGMNVVVGILSDDYQGLNYFDGITVDTGNASMSTKVLHLTADNIPEQGEGLRACNYILIDNYNTSQLSKEQRNAVMSWVSNGGVLILGTGSKASVVMGGFQEYLGDVTVGSLSKQEFTVVNGYEEPQMVDTVSVTGDNWTDVQASIAVGAPAVQSSYGKGSILILGYDLAMEPIVSWKSMNWILAGNVLENAGTDYTNDKLEYASGSDYEIWSLQETVEGVDRNKVPNALLYAGLFLVYVLCIGPVMYLVLKAKDCREKMWIVMPIIAGVFTVVIYGTSMLYRIHKPFVDAVSIVEFNAGTVTNQTFMTIQSPKTKEYEIALAEGYQLVSARDDIAYSRDYESGSVDYDCAVRSEGAAAQLIVQPSMAFTQQQIKTQKEAYQPGKDIVIDLECSVNGFSGTVTNQTGYDLKNVVVCYDTQYAYVGDLKQGEAANISLADMKTIRYVSYDMSDWMEKTPQDFPFARSEENRKLQDNQNLYEVMESVANGLTMNQGMVFGMIDNYQSDLIQDTNTKVYACAVAVSYFNQMPVEYQNYGLFIEDINEYMVGGYSIPYTNVYPEGFEYFYDTNDLDMYDASEKLVLYDFSQLNVTDARLIKLDSNMYSEEDDYYGNYYQYAQVQLYNYNTLTYEDVFDEEGMSGDLTSYINENGWMQIRYYADDEDNWYYAPNISLVGGGK